MLEQLPHPFHPGEHLPGAPMLTGDRSPLAQALAEHVVGQRVTHVEFTRAFDEQASKEVGVPLDRVDVTLYLANNVAYCARLVLPSLAVVSRGEALAHVQAGEPHYAASAAH